MSALTERRFGTCCNTLAQALAHPEVSFFMVDEQTEILYLSYGYSRSGESLVWQDAPVLFCPFCGALLQELDKVRSMLHSPPHN
ncbi:MAG TPA: hypothetical protein VNT75_10870 [Symbiobacteriaceae bacterium]|nr:hypothetical protein [Symbiobacteriaceae bacterium]